MKMDEKLRYFLYAAQTLSFKKAAAHFFVSATAVSKGVSSLEDEIGVKLFNRHNNSIELSQAGQHFTKIPSIYYRIISMQLILLGTLIEPLRNTSQLVSQVFMKQSCFLWY